MQKLAVEGSDDCSLYHIQDFWVYGCGEPPNIAENNTAVRKLAFFSSSSEGIEKHLLNLRAHIQVGTKVT